MGLIHLAAIAVAALATSLLVPISMRLAISLGMLDEPDARKVHTTPSPRLGGVAMVAGMLIAGFAAAIVLIQTGELEPSGIGLKLLAITGAGLAVFAVGVTDDIRTV